jgi:D-cysteine desulfhydrase family pyridoxal phosphate-dependent enzyme
MKHLSFANLPTPIQHLDRLGEKLGFPNLYIKRDDLTGIAFGGNKTRKLEYVIYDAMEQKADIIITVGGLQSNHVRQTAAICAKFHLECILVLNDGESEEIPSGNLFLNELFGAKIVTCAGDQREETVDNLIKKAQADGRKPYYIPLGASTCIGAYAYKKAFDELIQQKSDFDWIVVASGSGGTQAGLVHGASAANWAGNILGISILFDKETLSGYIAPLLTEMADHDQVHKIAASSLLINDNYLGDGYGVMGESEKKAILNFAQHEGVLLDPVYTGRAAGAMLDLMRKSYFSSDDRILFWHTGGTPALFCEKYRKFLLS